MNAFVCTNKSRSSSKGRWSLGSRSPSGSRSSLGSGSQSASRSASGFRSPARSLRSRTSSVFTAESDSEGQEVELSGLSEDEGSTEGESGSEEENEEEESDVEVDVENVSSEQSEASKTSGEGIQSIASVEKLVPREEDLIHKSSSAPVVAETAAPVTARSTSAMEVEGITIDEDARKASEVSEYDVFRNDHCYCMDEQSMQSKLEGAGKRLSESRNSDMAKFMLASENGLQSSQPVNNSLKHRRSQSPTMARLKAIAAQNLVQAVVPLSSTAKKTRRRRINNELASLLPPPVDVSRLNESDFEQEVKVNYEQRSEEQEHDILHKFQKDGFDKEDLMYLEKAFYEMQNDGTANWHRNLFWVPPCEMPIIKLLVSVLTPIINYFNPDY
ncbi:unnamed protein product [Toxocara canis]|uniref:ELM2 domain-containing protein n=1 Tax=Toxocara canis TaxID=6265 RepID=A0A183U325_TOXCA|nr:unnamed protein product [Toxocara canis]